MPHSQDPEAILWYLSSLHELPHPSVPSVARYSESRQSHPADTASGTVMPTTASLMLACSYECIHAALAVDNQCPTCQHSLDAASSVFPNHTLRALTAAAPKRRKTDATTHPANSDDEIERAFATRLYNDRLQKLQHLHDELEGIKFWLAQHGISAPTLSTSPSTVPEAGHKRHHSTTQDTSRVERVMENFDSLAESYSAHHDKTLFSSELRAAARIYKPHRIGFIRQHDGLGTASQIISSIEADRSGRLFATAGVQKRIKLYSLANITEAPADDTRRHHPVVDIACRAKLSCLGWNPYFDGQLCGADYDGAVTLHDTSSEKVVAVWTEHEKRTWSVDTSTLDPFRIASASDDCKVKIWTPKSAKSVLTIDVKANACSVRFSPTNVNTVAVGAADHRVLLFDLRKTALPVASLKQHRKAVSYVRFTDTGVLVSASTDSTLRQWTGSDGTWQCSRTYAGHVNEKNFVGLSVLSDLYATGSETNALHVYHPALRTPVLQHSISNCCPLTRVEMAQETGTFVSCVSWARICDDTDSPILLAANSAGCIEILSIKSV